MKLKHNVVVAAVGLGLCAWVAEAALDYVFFLKNGFLQVLFTNQPADTFQTRLLMLFCFVLFGIVTSRVVGQQSKVDSHAEFLNSLLMAIRRVNEHIAQEEELQAVLDGASHELIEVRPYAGCSIFLLDDSNQLHAASHAGEHTLEGSWTLTRDGDGNGLSCIKEALKTGDLRIIEDTGQCAGCLLHPSDGEERYRTINVPMATTGEPVGVLQVTLERSANVAAEEKWLLREVAGDLAQAREKLRVKTQLRENEEKYRKIFNNAHDAIYLNDLEEGGRVGTFLEVNDVACDMLGYSRREFLQMKPQDVDAGTDPEKFNAIMATLVEKGNVTFQTEHRTRDGSIVPVEINSQVFSMGDKKRVLSVARNITERKRAAERHSQVVETTADGFWMVDLEGQIKEVNDSYCEMVGYSRKELLGMSISDMQPHNSPEDVTARLRTIMGQGHHRFETRHVRKDGSTINVEISASYFEPGGGRIFAFLRDITQRKKAEQRLRIRDRAIQASLNGIAIVDLNGNIRSVNPAALDMWGYNDSSEVLGTKADTYWASRDRAIAAFKSAIQRGQWRGDMTAEKDDGTTFQVHASFSSIPADDGEVAYVVGVFRDISQRKKAQNRLREAHRELRETQQQIVDQERKRALSQMASGIAHDFNNALSPIRGYAELLLNSPDKLQDPGTIKRHLNDIKKAADHAAETVRRMRKFYRPRDEWEYQMLDVNSIVQESISMARPRWKQEAQAAGVNIEMRTEFGDLPPLKGNESELQEIMTNLLFNAVDAMEEDGYIEVATRAKEEQIIIEVSDSGHGMDEETLQHCLDPFFTTKAETGTGLGLSVTQSIARRHGGHVEAESMQGRGSTFRVFLPADNSGEEHAEKEQAPTEERTAAPEARSLHILVVEDDQMQRNLITAMLRSDGHEVDAAAQGMSGLEKFSAGWYDVVLTDRAMPEMGGDELASLVKDAAPDKPVIMLTGFGEMMEAAEEEPEDVDTVVSKPISQQKLRRAFDQVLDGAFVITEDRCETSAMDKPTSRDDSEPDEDLDSLLQSLHEQLHDNDLQATELATRLADELSGTRCGEEAQQLADTVHIFDFAPARELLQHIAEKLDVPLDGQES